jgi:hypothetical protein
VFLTFMVVLAVVSSSVAQATQTQKADTARPGAELAGKVVGHVYCADTNGPARLAQVTLEPVAEVDEYQPHRHGHTTPQVSEPSFNSVTTGFDGSFTIERVPAGTYYVIADLAGYISPIARFSESDLEGPDSKAKEAFRKNIPRITIQGDQMARINVTLEHGAVISGKVTFEDGSPVTGSSVRIQRRDKDGKLAHFRPSLLTTSWSNGLNTDDRGWYRLAGLPAGEYVLEVDLLGPPTKGRRSDRIGPCQWHIHHHWSRQAIGRLFGRHDAPKRRQAA